MTTNPLRDKIAAAVSAYDRANPMRSADWHGEDCNCLRCEMDCLRAILDAHPEQPAPDAVAEAAKVLLAVLEDPDSLPIEKHPNWQEVYAEMQSDHAENIEIFGLPDWPSTLIAALRALASQKETQG